MLDMTLTYLHSLMLLRKGVRFNDSFAINAAKSKLMMLFYGQNHPIYKEILLNDLKVNCWAPIDVKMMIDQNLSTSRSEGNFGHYQSGDALLEEINKNAKKWIIGVPTKVQWEKSFRNLDTLEAWRDASVDAAGINDPSRSVGHRDHSQQKNEVFAVRALFRSKEYLSNPLHGKAHKDISGDILLSEKLQSFSVHSEKNFFDYVNRELSGSEAEIHPIFATSAEEAEYQKIERKKTEVIVKEAFEIVGEMDISDQNILLDYYKKHVKNKKKQLVVDFYYQVQSTFDKKYNSDMELEIEADHFDKS